MDIASNHEVVARYVQEINACLTPLNEPTAIAYPEGDNAAFLIENNRLFSQVTNSSSIIVASLAGMNGKISGIATSLSETDAKLAQGY